MVATSYRHNSTRARQARLAARVGQRAQKGELVAIGALVAASMYLLATHHAIGWSVLGFDLLLIVAYLWQHRSVQDLQVKPEALNTQTVRLDQVAEINLLARFKPDMEPADIWLAAAQQWQGTFILLRLGIPYDVVGDTLRHCTLSPENYWDLLVSFAREQPCGIDSGIVIGATLLQIPDLKPLLAHLKLKTEDVTSALAWQRRLAEAMVGQNRNFGGIGRDWASGYTPLLNQFAINMSKEVESGYYRHLPSSHESIIDQLVQLMAENRPAVLVGGVGSGRTSIVYALAERILAADRAPGLAYYQVMSLNASTIITAGGQVEDVVTQLLVEAVQAKNTILYLDEAQLFFNTGTGSIDLSRILLPILQRNVIKIICSITDHDWQALTAQQPALAGLLQRVAVGEPSALNTTEILQDAAIGIEHRTNSIITLPAINEAVRLAGRYLPEVSFPGKGITVLESAAHYPDNGFITPVSVQQAIEATTGAKVTAASAPERDQLLNLEEKIHERMINQTHAVKVVSDALRRARAGVASSKRPVGSFLFLGPTGVGKTELAKSLAAIYFGGEQVMIRLDMSEYQQQHDMERLLAPSSGAQAGASLLSAVRQNPSTVVLLDEIEKAHPDLLNLLLQLLDEGRLTDSDGREVSFRDAIVIATSNAAADEIRDRITKGEQLETFEPTIVEQLIASHQFKPELLNRFDEIVVFRPLTKSELLQVVGLMLQEVNATLAEQNVTVGVTPVAAAWLVDQGYDPRLGARPLRRMVQRSVENVIAERLLRGTIQAGQSVTLDVSDLQPATSAIS